MTPETFMYPSTCVLPFEMFRSYEPTFDKNRTLPAWTPACDIYETEKEIVLKIDLPEMNRADVHGALEGKLLTLRGERKFEATVNREDSAPR